MEYRLLLQPKVNGSRRVPVYFEAADDDAAREHIASTWSLQEVIAVHGLPQEGASAHRYHDGEQPLGRLLNLLPSGGSFLTST